jgi:hypothetical protein
LALLVGSMTDEMFCVLEFAAPVVAVVVELD